MTSSDSPSKTGHPQKNYLNVAKRKIRFGHYQRQTFTLTEKTRPVPPLPPLSDDDSISLSSVESLSSERSNLSVSDLNSSSVCLSPDTTPSSVPSPATDESTSASSAEISAKQNSEPKYKFIDPAVGSKYAFKSKDGNLPPISSVLLKNNLNAKKLNKEFKNKVCPLTDEDSLSLSSAEISPPDPTVGLKYAFKPKDGNLKTINPTSSVLHKNNLNAKKSSKEVKSKVCPLTDEDSLSLSSAEISPFHLARSRFTENVKSVPPSLPPFRSRKPADNDSRFVAELRSSDSEGSKKVIKSSYTPKKDTDEDSVSFSSAEYSHSEKSDRRDSGFQRNFKPRRGLSGSKFGNQSDRSDRSGIRSDQSDRSEIRSDRSEIRSDRSEIRSDRSEIRSDRSEIDNKPRLSEHKKSFYLLTDEETVSLSSVENNASVSGSSSVSSTGNGGGTGRVQIVRQFFEKSSAIVTENRPEIAISVPLNEDANSESCVVDDDESHGSIEQALDEEENQDFEYASDSDQDDIDPDKKTSFSLIRGSDPRIATCRGKLQNKRSKLNQEINKELRLRAGAENLFKATTNRKLKETVALELSFVNSNLQLLKEQLAELNSSVEIYQGESPEPVMPMIPLGLKETKEIDFREPFKDFILEHYSEDGSSYENAIAEFMELRQAMRTPNRDNAGIALLFQYYNQLYFVERRFFPPDRSLGIYFEWYDSLTGVPSCQKTVAFEKACVLFNMAAVYTQMGAKQDRLTEKGLDQAVDSFLRAAGTYTYIQENFTNAPSMDLAPQMLNMLVHLMLAQARECLFEKLELQSEEKRNVDVWLDLAQESAQLAQVYETVHSLITMASVREYVPYSWVSLVQVKHQHYAGLAHFHGAIALLSKTLAQLSERSKDMLHYLHVEPDYKTPSHIQLESEEQRKQLGKAHLKSALQMHEESQRLQRMCRELRNKKALSRVLARTFDNVAETLADTEEEDTFSEILEAPCIQPSTKFQLSLTPPDFAHLPVEDLFKQLGPVAIFSAKHHWTAPRSVRLQRSSSHDVGFGFSVRGDSPVIVAAVDQGSLAHFGGMKEGDFIVAIGTCDVKWSQHDHVVKLIKEAGDSLSLKLVTPMDRNYLKPKTKSNQSESGSGTGTGGSSNSGTGTQGNSPNGSVNTHKKLTWNPFKKHRERETSFNLISR